MRPEAGQVWEDSKRIGRRLLVESVEEVAQFERVAHCRVIGGRRTHMQAERLVKHFRLVGYRNTALRINGEWPVATCDWCGEEATTRFKVEGSATTVFACERHEARAAEIAEERGSAEKQNVYKEVFAPRRKAAA